MRQKLLSMVVIFVALYVSAFSVEAQTTEETLLQHLQAVGDGDIDAIMADYAEDARIFTADGTLHGHEEIRPLFESIIADILPPGSDLVMMQQIVEGEIAYILWSADSANYSIPLATDTFVIRDGKITTQTLAARIIPKDGSEVPPQIRLELPESVERDVFLRRLQAIADGDIDALMSCYADDAVLIMPNGVLRGHDQIMPFFSQGLGGGAYGLPFQLLQAVIEGETAYTIWSAESEFFDTPFGTDTIIIRDGKVAFQTFAAQMIPAEPPAEDFSHVFSMSLEPGLNMISLPLKPTAPYTARSLAGELSATVVIKYDTSLGRFVGFTPGAPDDGFSIEGGQGYIVNVPTGGMFSFTGAAWTDDQSSSAAPPLAQRQSAWAFVVSGSLSDAGGRGCTAVAKNLRTGTTVSAVVAESGYFAAAYADLSRRSIIEAGDSVEVTVIDGDGEVVLGPFVFDITLDEIRDAVLDVRLRPGNIIPARSVLFQNYPNPFNPETWMPYQLRDASFVTIRVYNSAGQLVRTMDLGYKDPGVYVSRSRAAYWDGKNEAGEEVASGIYFYRITADDFSAVGKMAVTK